jgi:hypothetical protein
MTARAFWHPLKNPFVGIDVALLPLYRNSFTFQNPEGINRMSFLGPTSKKQTRPLHVPLAFPGCLKDEPWRRMWCPPAACKNTTQDSNVDLFHKDIASLDVSLRHFVFLKKND